ncbi:hypothetical protein M0534_11630 [Methylonatrum kenyense]|uniref:hypothetical protein n=1 Tax=Methylonatrum kenyense TaxID=455253 RepID=UPI0020BF1784|nr:hypothetical protein [Methylonatrum kenyense]MCK8516970.1 hypothetical protein [Methylonatrum kenyense]
MKNPDLYVCGFGWSGSGALIDFLLDSGVYKKFPGGEVQFIKINGGFLDLFKAAKEKKEFSADDLDIFLRHFTGNLNKEVNYSLKANQKSAKLWTKAGPAYSSWIFESFSRMVGVDGRGENPSSVVESIYHKFIDIFRFSGSSFVLDQAIRPTNLDPLNFVGDGKVIIVDRDPRDSYYERRAFQGSRFTLTPEQYAENYLKRRRKMKRSLAGNLSDRVKIVGFEEFVRSPDVRFEICQWVGVQHHFKPERFNPDVSRNNIGIHKGSDEPWFYERLTDILDLSGP